MSKFKPMELIDKMSGKFHSKSKYYAAEKYGTQYTGIVGEINVPPTAAQVANRTKFVYYCPSECEALTPTEIDAYKAAYKADKQGYKCLQGYIFAQEYAKL